jgi:cytochrome c-type biogenesis protein CcmH
MMPPVTRSAALAVAPFDLRPRLFPTPRVAALAVALLALLVLFAAVTLPGTAFAAAPQEDLALQQRLKHLESELRCLVCQNQTLADSNSELANDLRDEVKKLALSGKNDDEIKSYLVARYGDFVLYRPPVKSTTWLL